MADESLTISLAFPDRRNGTLELSLPPPDIWTEQDAGQFLTAIHAALNPAHLHAP